MMSDLKRIEIVRIKDIPEVHTVEVSYVENYEDAIRMPPDTWKDKLYPKILDGIDKCLKITCEKDRQTNNWIYTAKMYMIHPDELFLTVGKENQELKSAYNSGWVDAINYVIKHELFIEPKKGKWVDIVEMDSGWKPFKVGMCCSACGFETVSEDNYCPHCGAKMEV